MSNITQMRVKGVDYDLSNLVNSIKTNSLENLDCSKNLIQATVSKATNFSLNGEMQIGQKIKLFIISNGKFIQTISGDNIKTDFGAKIDINKGDIISLEIECYDTNKYFISGKGANPLILSDYITISTSSSGDVTIYKLLDSTGSSTEEIIIPASSTDYKIDGLIYGFKMLIENRGDAEYITSLNVSYFDTSNMTNMAEMFQSCWTDSLDVSNFDTSKVTDMRSMFQYCGADSLDLSSFDTSNVTDMSYMFSGCGANSLDVSNFDTSKVTNMSYMFSSYKADLLDVSNFDTSNVTNMNGMFFSSKLTTLDLSNFDTSKVTNMSSMFETSEELAYLNLSNFDTSNVTDMSYMFSTMSISSLDLSSFNTSNVTSMHGMFSYCYSLASLDLSNFDTSKVTSMYGMFSDCLALTHIKCKQAFKNWCWTNQDTIKLPDAMRDGGSGTWEIVG